MNWDLIALYIAAAVGGVIMSIFAFALLSILWESLCSLWNRGDRIERLEREVSYLKSSIDIMQLNEKVKRK